MEASLSWYVDRLQKSGSFRLSSAGRINLRADQSATCSYDAAGELTADVCQVAQWFALSIQRFVSTSASVLACQQLTILQVLDMPPHVCVAVAMRRKMANGPAGDVWCFAD